jgi:HEAT repeat protein
VILGFAALLVVIFSLLSHRSASDSEAEALWLAAFEQKDLPVQIAAAKALGEIGKTSDAAAARLLEALENIEPLDIQLKVSVIEAVGNMGFHGKTGISTIQKLAQAHAEQSVRGSAIQSLDKLKAASPPGRSGWFYLNLLTILSAGGAAGWLYWKQPK